MVQLFVLYILLGPPPALQRLIVLPGDDHRSAFAPGHQARARVQSQSGLWLLAAVAFVTLRDQQRPDFGLEERAIGGVVGE